MCFTVLTRFLEHPHAGGHMQLGVQFSNWISANAPDSLIARAGCDTYTVCSDILPEYSSCGSHSTSSSTTSHAQSRAGRRDLSPRKSRRRESHSAARYCRNRGLCFVLDRLFVPHADNRLSTDRHLRCVNILQTTSTARP